MQKLRPRKRSGLVDCQTSSEKVVAVQGATDTPPPSSPLPSKRFRKSRVVSAQPAPGFEMGDR